MHLYEGGLANAIACLLLVYCLGITFWDIDFHIFYKYLSMELDTYLPTRQSSADYTQSRFDLQSLHLRSI